jgi:hypothetical protein
MARITLHITKDDINTKPIGLHFDVEVSPFLTLNFTRQAIEELYSDMVAITKQLQDERSDTGPISEAKEFGQSQVQST